MTIPLTPLFDKILIKRPEEFSETGGGIIIPETSREKAMNGEIVSIGQDVKQVKKGQTIMFAKYAGTDVTFDDKNQYLIIAEKDVLGVMK
jgi:chaperonin GroES